MKSDDDVPDLAGARVVRRGPARKPLLTLRGVREAAGKTQAEVAEALGGHQGAISRLEGQDDTSVSTLAKYADALGAKLEITFVFPRGHRFELDMKVKK